MSTTRLTTVVVTVGTVLAIATGHQAAVYVLRLARAYLRPTPHGGGAGLKRPGVASR